MSTSIINIASSTPSVEKLLAANEKWNAYVNGALASTQAKMSRSLAYMPSGIHNKRHSRLDSEESSHQQDEKDDDDSSSRGQQRKQILKGFGTNDFPDFAVDEGEEVDDYDENG